MAFFLRKLLARSVQCIGVMAGALGLIGVPEQAHASAFTYFYCDTPAYTGATYYNVNVACHLAIYRPPGDIGNGIPYGATLGVHVGGDTATGLGISLPGYACYLNDTAARKFLCYGAPPLGGTVAADMIINFQGACGKQFSVSANLAHSYLVNVPYGPFAFNLPQCPPPPPPPPPACKDGADNDGDGLIDLADPGCTSPDDNNEGDGTTQCQDGLDNDGDGAIDFPADFSCSSKQDNDEANPKAQCQDGLDNDNDGLIDLADPGCASKQDNNESDGTAQCQDGIDNDGDGAIDFPADFSCSSKTDNDEADPKSQCQDGIDNDGDGATDYPADFSCSNAQDNDETNQKSQCQDGQDNDGDGLIDASDPGCTDKQDNSENGGTTQCQDGIDNDGDGAIDFPADFSCANKQDNDEANPKSQCQDNLDNDSDGLLDLTDPGCTSKQDNNEADGTSACQDGKDNDGDGLVDLADPGCANGQDLDETDEAAKLKVTLECVYDNGNGSYTAYYGYENLFGTATSVITDAAKKTINSFGPLPADRGQTSAFKVGRVKGAFGVTFDGSALTWTVQVAGGKSSATATKESTPCKAVEPVAECIDAAKDGFRGTFGYINSNEFEIAVPLGDRNGFNPAPSDRGQPSIFFPGTNKGVVSTLFASQLDWKIGARTASVTPKTPVCLGGCIETPTGTIKGDLDAVALKLAALTKQAADFLAARAKVTLKGGAAAQVATDSKRAKQRADQFVKRANELTLKFPAVVKNCPNSAQFCQTVDRQETIEALKGLYAQQRNAVKRIVARGYFNKAGSTNRQDALVSSAKASESAGLVALSQLPRFATECK